MRETSAEEWKEHEPPLFHHPFSTADRHIASWSIDASGHRGGQMGRGWEVDERTIPRTHRASTEHMHNAFANEAVSDEITRSLRSIQSARNQRGSNSAGARFVTVTSPSPSSVGWWTFAVRELTLISFSQATCASR